MCGDIIDVGLYCILSVSLTHCEMYGVYFMNLYCVWGVVLYCFGCVIVLCFRHGLYSPQVCTIFQAGF